jgi:methionyl-tRNA formyltransferase
LGATNFSKELLIFLLDLGYVPKIIFSIPENFNITYSGNKKVIMKNYNYADLKEIAKYHRIMYCEVNSVEGKKIKDYEPLIKELNLDLMLVLGWYYLIPKRIRDLAKYGAWGIHASLLPNYAGSAPLVWAIINGEEETGVTLFRLSDGIDNGDIIVQKSFKIEFEDTINDVYKKAIICSKEILRDVLENIYNIKFTPQPKDKIKVYPPRFPEDGLIDWHQEAKKIYDFIRAQTLPYPCAFSFINNKKIKIISSKIYNESNTSYEPGQIIELNNVILVATKDKFLEILEIDIDNNILKFKDYVKDNNLIGKIFKNS